MQMVVDAGRRIRGGERAVVFGWFHKDKVRDFSAAVQRSVQSFASNRSRGESSRHPQYPVRKSGTDPGGSRGVFRTHPCGKGLRAERTPARTSVHAGAQAVRPLHSAAGPQPMLRPAQGNCVRCSPAPEGRIKLSGRFLSYRENTKTASRRPHTRRRSPRLPTPAYTSRPRLQGKNSKFRGNPRSAAPGKW